MIRLKCYEPPGKVIELQPESLCRHVLAIGATGTGKTSALVNPLLRQAIAWHCFDRDQRVGLLVLDAKADETPQKVLEYARRAGREGDVVVLSERGDSRFDFFGGLRRLSQVQEYATRVLYGSREMGAENAYWTESRLGLVQCALALLLVDGEFDFDEATRFLHAFCYERRSEKLAERLRFVERLVKAGRLSPAARRRLELTLVEARNWAALDDRTLELHRSTLSNALRPLLAPEARAFFDPSRPRRFDPSSVLEGKILVCSINAASQPQLAALLFRVLKREYYAAVLSRVAVRPEKDRLCGLILDELPLAATADDPEALAVLRSKGGFIVAATQGLAALDEVMGRRRRDMLLSNFCSCFFFGARETQTDELALLTLGMPDHRQKKRDFGGGEEGVYVLDVSEPWPPLPVCPPGALARLHAHQAYVKLADGEVTERHVWLEPLFHDYSPEPQPVEPDDLAQAAARLRQEEAEKAKMKGGPPLLLASLHERGRRLRTTPAIVAAAWPLCVPSISRASLLEEARCWGHVKGMELLPSCWLRGLLRWLEANPKEAPSITEVSPQSAVLWVQVEASSGSLDEEPLAVAESINLWVYPSLWRPLRKNHWVRLLCERPDLRSELLSLPQAVGYASPGEEYPEDFEEAG